VTVQTAGVVDANVTVSPDVELATNTGEATPMVCIPGVAKVMVCAGSTGAATAAEATVKVLTIAVAGAKAELPA
jgi:hypothetical protein